MLNIQLHEHRFNDVTKSSNKFNFHLKHCELNGVKKIIINLKTLGALNYCILTPAIID